MNPTHLIEVLLAQIDQLKGQQLAIGLCTTSPSEEKKLDYFSFPRHHKTGLVYIHLVLSDTATALKIGALKQLSKALFFIDVEAKNSAFDGRAIIRQLDRAQCYSMEPNTLTVDALMMQILDAGIEKKCLVVGSGNIARALCARLSGIGADFCWIATAGRAGTAHMQRLFPANHVNDIHTGFDIVINCVPVSGAINFERYICESSLFIEVTGVSLPELERLKCQKKRLDVSAHQLFFAKNTLDFESQKPSFGRGKVDGCYVCSGGYIGQEGDLVVDDFISPSHVVGVADGLGGFAKRYAISFADFLSTHRS